MRVMRILGLLALAALVGGAFLLVTGFNESSRRAIERQNGYLSIPGDSPFVRSVLAEPMTDDAADVSHATWVLNLAGRRADASSLETFFGVCNARRLLGSDDACRAETVASAIDKAQSLDRTAKPVGAPAPLEARLADSVSFFLPDEAMLRAGTDENTWRRHRYDGPGVARFESSLGAYLFIGARNHSEWTIKKLRAVLTLRLPNGTSHDVACNSEFLYPFFTRSMEPGGAMIARCELPGAAPLDEVISAMHATAPDAPAVQLATLDLKNPYAAIVHRGAAAKPRFTVAPLPFSDALDRTITFSTAQSPKSLLDMDCHELGNCPNAYQALAMSLSQPFLNHLLLIPPLLGVLLGIVIGGFVRRSFMAGSAFAGLLVLVAVGGIVLLFQSTSSRGGENGFALMAIGALTFGAAVAFVVGLPAFFVTLVLMRALRSWLTPPAPAEGPV